MMDNSKSNLLIISTIPAPYRMNIFKEISKEFQTLIFLERATDISRNNNWLMPTEKLTYYTLTEKEDKRLYKDYCKKLSQFDAVLVYEYSTITAIKLMFTCILKKVPYFINCDGGFIKKNIIKKMLKMFFIKFSTACFANGTYGENYFLHFGANKEKIYKHEFSSLLKADILIDVLSTDQKIALKQKLNLKQQKTIISVGQFIHRKGFDLLLKAWVDFDSYYTLVIVGGGEKEEEYINFVKSKKYCNVIIKPFLSKMELFEYYKASDLFVLPTREDIWGLVINEAMACGLPVITTSKCIAGLELIEDYKNGFIVPVEDNIELTKKMRKILDSDSLSNQMANENLKKIRNYNIENMAQALINSINQIFKGIA